jgi:hypothetical protein
MTRNPDGAVELVDPVTFKHTWRVTTIFIVLCIMSLLSAIDSTIITTSLPTIADDIGGATDYVWIANSYLFASTVPQPLYGQIANIFGRRNPLYFAIFLFVLGSGIGGGANSAGMLIAGRVIQGLGTGGLYVLSEIIICDIVPPRFRGPYVSAVLSTAAIGTTIGPIIGGALAVSNWRWIFWLNLPVMGAAIVAIHFFLKVKYKQSSTWRQALARVDFVGNAIFIPAMTSIFFGLIAGGQQYPWGSWRIILPLVLGCLGWAAFHVYEASRWCVEPSTPPRLFKNRTSATGFLLIFLASIVLQAISYFMPVYFQATKQASPLQSGVWFLPFALAIIPFGGMAGGFMSFTGQYRPLHWAGFIFSAIGTGLFSTLTSRSSQAAWIGFQILAAAGSGFVFTATLPSTLAPLSEADVAVATGTYSFVRSLGLVWGVTMASIVFNGEINRHVERVADQDLHSYLVDGAAYAYAAGGTDGNGGITLLPEPSRSQVIGLYELALGNTWLVFAGISCLGFFAVFIERHVELRKHHETDFGHSQEEATSDDAEKGG